MNIIKLQQKTTFEEVKTELLLTSQQYAPILNKFELIWNELYATIVKESPIHIRLDLEQFESILVTKNGETQHSFNSLTLEELANAEIDEESANFSPALIIAGAIVYYSMDASVFNDEERKVAEEKFEKMYTVGIQ